MVRLIRTDKEIAGTDADGAEDAACRLSPNKKAVPFWNGLILQRS